MAEVNMDIKTMDRRVQWGLVIASVATLVLMIIAALSENVFPQWRRTRLEYAEILAEKATDDRGRGIAARFEIGVDQNVLPELEKVDRCITCHAGIDDPRMADQPKDTPFRSHPGDFLANHPPSKYGCTICHQGQGRATSLPDAHGDVPFWPEPLLAGEMTYTSCGRCHYENDLYGGESDLYGPEFRTEQITQGDLASHVAGADAIARGKQLVIERGCLGCHTYRDRGGNLGPDITYVGDKTVHDFDFEHVKAKHTVLNWLTAHFKSPAMVVPETLMPDMGLSDDESHDLAVYMLSLKRKLGVSSYTPIPGSAGRGPVDSTPAEGHSLYLMYCSSCHGADGVGAVARVSGVSASGNSGYPGLEAIDRPRELLTPSLRNQDTLAVASDDYLRHIIQHGRSGTGMPAWGADGGLSSGEMDRLVAAIRGWQDSPPPVGGIAARRGDPAYGQKLYHSRCMGCHGPSGEGGVGVSLRSPSFLAVASDEFLRDTILHGRPNTAMPSWPELSAADTSHLLAYIRGWQRKAPAVEAVVALLIQQPRAVGTTGRILYQSNCGNCHGKSGEGALGPSLRTEEFLSVVDNRYLAWAIIKGRPDTAMPAWTHLDTEGVADMIRHVRSWYSGPPKLLKPYPARGDWDDGQNPARGDWDYGQILFEGACAGCHGRNAEGGVGPQLANPTFLESASDAMLREWISYGKMATKIGPELGTPMPAFLRGEQGVTEMSASQIEDIVTWLRHNQGKPRAVTARPGVGIPAVGAEIYAGTCSGCHGARGEGLVGSALSNPHFLRHASDGYLAATITLGRENTPMTSLAAGQQGIVELDDEEVANVVAFLRTWEHEPPPKVPFEQFASEADQLSGKELFTGFCAGCHGANGRDSWAPALNNPEFLAAASDGFLKATIARGRGGTAMRSFGKGGGGIATLTAEQIDDIVSHVRSWGTSSPAQPSSPKTRSPNKTEPTQP